MGTMNALMNTDNKSQQVTGWGIRGKLQSAKLGLRGHPRSRTRSSSPASQDPCSGNISTQEHGQVSENAFAVPKKPTCDHAGEQDTASPPSMAPKLGASNTASGFSEEQVKGMCGHHVSRKDTRKQKNTHNRPNLSGK